LRGKRYSVKDVIKLQPKWRITKYRVDDRIAKELYKTLHEDGIQVEHVYEYFGVKPYEDLNFSGNIALNEGINLVFTLICGGAGTPWNSANARIGVGDSSATESVTQTGLQGTNKAFKGMDSGYPTFGTGQQATWRATFGATEANFTWNEITVVNGADDSAINLNRKVQAMGTKASGSIWIATLTITAT